MKTSDNNSMKNKTTSNKEKQHILLTFALLRGYEFTRHGWLVPGAEEPVKVMDDGDYDALNLSFQDLLELEKENGIQVEMTRTMGIFFVLGYSQKGETSDFTENLKIPACKTAHEALFKALYEILKDKVKDKIPEVIKEYPWNADLDEHLSLVD